MMAAEMVYEKVSEFLEARPSGWVKEAEVKLFLEAEVNLANLCVSLTQLQDYDKLESLLKFLEIATTYHSIAIEFLQPQYEPYLSDAVRAPSDRLRGIVANAIAHVDMSVLPTRCQFEILMVLFADDDTGISVKVGKTILKWTRSLLAGDMITLAQQLVHYFKEPNSFNETVQFRYISLFIELGAVSAQIFSVFDEARVFDEIVSTFLGQSDDILVKLGSLTLIESLSKYESGQIFLAKSKILLALEKELPQSDSTTVISLMFAMASIMPLVADVAKPVLLGPIFRPILARFIVSPNSAERICAIKVLALLACEEPALTSFLRSNWKLFDQVVFALTDFTDIEIINAALDTVCQVVRRWESNLFLESEPSQRRLVDQLLTTFQRHPFPESRALVYAALANIMHAGLVEGAMEKLLADSSPIRRNLFELSDRESRLAKLDFVRVLVRENLEPFFEKAEVAQLETFARLGMQHHPQRDEMETEAV